MNRKRWPLALAAVFLCGCSMQPVDASGAERELLCQFRDGRRCQTDNLRYWEEENSAWDLGWLVMDDQRGRPTEVQLSFTEDEDRAVFALNKNYEIVWQSTFGKGEHSIPISDNMMGIMFSVKDGETVQTIGTGMHPRMETPLTGKRLSVLGDSVSAFAGFLDDDTYSYYGDWNFGAASMWWAVLAEKTGMEICRINAVSGSGVIVPEDDRKLMGHSERCTDLSARDGTKPDEILVFLGGNDYLAGIPVEQIRKESIAMLSDIKKAYPDASIHVCTYFPSPAKSLKEMNDMLRDVAKQANVGLIDLENCGIMRDNPQKYLIDGQIHPNERGQILVGVCAAQQMLKEKEVP